MPVGTTQLFDNTIQDWMDGTTPLWNASAGAGNYALLYDEGTTAMVDTYLNISAVTAAGFAEATSTDYDPEQMGTCAIGGTAPQANFTSAIVSFTDTGSITAKYFVAAEGLATASATDDPVLFFVDLDTTATDSTVSSTNAAFTVDDSTAGWFYIAEQA